MESSELAVAGQNGVWRSSWAKKTAVSILCFQFIVVAFNALVSYQAAYWVAQEGSKGRVLGLAYCSIYLAYAATIMFQLWTQRTMWQYQVLLTFAMFGLVTIYARGDLGVVLFTSWFLLPVSTVVWLLHVKFRNA